MGAAHWGQGATCPEIERDHQMTTKTKPTETAAAPTGDITVSVTLPATITRKIAGYTYTFSLADIPNASLAALLTYGFRLPADSANSVAKALRDSKKVKTNEEAGWLKTDSDTFFDAVMDGSIAEKARRAAGGSVLDPVTEEAVRLACSHILDRLGVKNWGDAAVHPVGKKYFTLRTPESGKPYPTRNMEAILDYIKRHDDKAKPENGFVSRAEVIVSARGAADSDEVDL